MNPVAVFVPGDAAAVSVGADGVARAIAEGGAARGVDLRIVRNGTRGMCWLEPLVEVETAGGRIAYGPVTRADVETLFEADFLHGGSHRLRQGPVEELPYFGNQDRLTFARVGVVDPASLDDYLAHGG
jgi:formate dehydrogenase iron-sulfur subunit